MSIKDILVHVDHTEGCETRLKLAVELAQQHGAFLRVLYARGGTVDSINTIAEQARQRFDAMVSGVESSFMAADPADPERSIMDQVVWHARHTDLIVVGQHNPNARSYTPKDMAEELMLEAGRPVLMVPYAWKPSPVGKRIMAAWNSGRESVRAINDAIPFMQKADFVTLLALNPRDDNKQHGPIPCEDIAEHLAKHGVQAKSQYLTVRDIDAGNMLLSCLADESIDMLVMGGYGHHRLRELILGGVTREVLDHMTVPVLMSH